ncbi:hypothetical protein [Paenibacillus sp. GbtcB18]|uniref:hypothetical protein n=1 Tax=Paenibacillus sp. GbtcB18 TaxID=2824763 RepID=UPI001C30D142|nr:hypothetical protein [Paenibacillus sp. GbtcB18]
MPTLHRRNNSLINRFDKLAEESDKLATFELMNENLVALETQLLASMVPEQQLIFREWQDNGLAMEYMKKEWIYVRAVQDGIKILSQLYSD